MQLRTNAATLKLPSANKILLSLIRVSVYLRDLRLKIFLNAITYSTVTNRKFESRSFAEIRGQFFRGYRFFVAQSPMRLSASSRFSMELAMLNRT
jgi:hypothetical protein